MSLFGEAAGSSGLNGVGKIIRPHTAAGSTCVDVGCTESDGCDAIVSLTYDCVCSGTGHSL